MHVTVDHHVVLFLDFFAVVLGVEVNILLRIPIKNPKYPVYPSGGRSSNYEYVHVGAFVLEAFVGAEVEWFTHIELNYSRSNQNQNYVESVAIPNMKRHHEHFQTVKVRNYPNKKKNRKVKDEAQEQLFLVCLYL